MSNFRPLACVLIGLSVGWIVGLSLSPVVGTVLGAVLATVGAVVTALSGLPTEGKTAIAKVNPWPLCAFLIGLAVAAPLGITVRDHGWLGGAASSSKDAATMRPTGLYNGPPSAKDCQELRSRSTEALRGGFIAADDPRMKAVGNNVDSVEGLKAIRELACAGQQ
jgi:hypothetical protein